MKTKKAIDRDETIFLPEVKPPADFIIVQKKIISEAAEMQNKKFISNLKKSGLTVEYVDGVRYTDLVFIKIKAPDDVLKRLCGIHGLFPTYQHDNTMPEYTRWLKCLKTVISLKPIIQDPIFQRCSRSVRGEENVTFTSCEKITLVTCVMERTSYGSSEYEEGLDNLLESKNFVDAYPLHDGPAEWTTSGPLNDRQILARYWASWWMICKFQPLHIIYKYYGSEVAFHYAWLEYYTKLLLIPLLGGIIVIMIGYYYLYLSPEMIERVREICFSKMKICPECTFKQCFYKNLEEYCDVAKWSFIIDNNFTIGLAVFLTIWGTVFVELWNRHESILAYKWNLHRSADQLDELPSYKIRVKNYKRYNKFTQTEEYYTPIFKRLGWYFISTTVCFLFFLTVIITDGLICITEHYVEYSIHKYEISWALDWSGTIVKFYSAFTTILFMQLYAPQLDRISEKLTDKEYHRTRERYLNSYLFKSYVMNFANSYLMLIYTAYFKEINYTNPSDSDVYDDVFGIAADVCPPGMGCVASLSANVTFTFLRDYILELIVNIYRVLNFVGAYRRIKSAKKAKGEWSNIPQWEHEYSLIPANTLFLAESYMSIVLEFGLLTFFIASVPLLPILAVINNLIECRLTAYALVRKTRRNVAKKVYGIAGWRRVMLIVLRLCFFIGEYNCFYIYICRQNGVLFST
ncbi:anoctamin-3-like isoform X2 [Onthophagus taurus]|uniref:anoctamin-3-like isoform X2 n=1 Tax=Onthophagus taurus TaxID=166361 RepID=UPI0039BE3A54